MTSVNEILKDHVTLEVECVDRMLLNGYIPQLQTGGQMVSFMMGHLNNKIPSPALLKYLTQKFVSGVNKFAREKGIPVKKFERREDKDAYATAMRKERGVRDDVVFIGVAQEKAKAFHAHKREKKGWVGFDYTRDKSVYVNHYYYYIDDEEFGPMFIKICSYAPWGIRVCLNGHEWVKRQLEKESIGYEELDNGFLSCESPERLQEICNELNSDNIERMFSKWLTRLPLPLEKKSRVAGYDWRLSISQMEVSLTQIFDRPLNGRKFFEEVIRDNLDIGRPDRVQLLFDRRIIKKTPGKFRTRVIQNGVYPSLYLNYKSFGLKQYFKEGRGCRTESTFNNPKDFGINKSLSNFEYLQKLGRSINRRLLDVQRVSHNCGLSGESVEKVVQPTVTEDGQRAPGLRFGDPRVMALFLALTLFSHLINGFRNADLRITVANLLGVSPDDYSRGRMTYDLRRLRLKGIIYRKEGTNRYFLTTYGWKVSRFFSRLEIRVLRPAMAAFDGDGVSWPAPLRRAMQNVDKQLDTLIEEAIPALKNAA